MDDFMVRLEEEQRDLEKKIVGLQAFITGNGNFFNLSKVQQALLSSQLDYMHSYNSILLARLEDLTA